MLCLASAGGGGSLVGPMSYWFRIGGASWRRRGRMPSLVVVVVVVLALFLVGWGFGLGGRHGAVPITCHVRECVVDLVVQETSVQQRLVLNSTFWLEPHGPFPVSLVVSRLD